MAAHAWHAAATKIHDPVWQDNERGEMHHCVATSRDGRWMLRTHFDASSVDVFRVDLPQHVVFERGFEIPVHAAVEALAVSPDSRSFAIGCSNWNAYVARFIGVDGRLVQEGVALQTFRGHTSSVTSVCFSQDSKHLVTGSTDYTVRIWDVASQTELRVLRNPSWVYSVDIIPNSSRVAAGMLNGTVYVWDVNGNEPIYRLLDFWSSVDSVACSNDGRWMACSSSTGTLRIYTSEGTPKHNIELAQTPIHMVAFSPNSALLAAACKNYICVWSVEDGTVQYAIETKGSVNRGVAFVGRSNNYVVTCADHRGVQVWDLRESVRNAILASLANPAWERFFLYDDGDHANATRVVGFS